MDGKMNVVEMPIESVIPYDNNPRINDEAVDAVAESIRNYGWQQPIVVDRDNVIIVGHTRRLAAMKLGLATVPVVVASGLTPEQVRAYRIDDNKTGEIATWDFARLQAEMEGLQEDGYDLSSMAFSEAELSRILENSESGDGGEAEEDAEGETGADEIPDVPDDEKYDSRRGTLYRLGDHLLVCGDCCEGAEIQLLMKGDGEEPVSLWLSDPPYNVAYSGRSGIRHDENFSKAVRNSDLKIANDDMSERDFQEFLKRAFCNCAAYMARGASFYLFHATSCAHNFRQALLDNGLEISTSITWAKNHFALGWGHYLQKTEPCWYGWKPGAASKWNGAHDATTTTLQQWDIVQAAKDHPTPKPVDMLKFFIKNSSDRNDIVLDTFGGSGSTLIACEQTGRICRMMEIMPKYADVIRRRWAQFVYGKKCDWKAMTPAVESIDVMEVENA